METNLGQQWTKEQPLRCISTWGPKEVSYLIAGTQWLCTLEQLSTNELGLLMEIAFIRPCQLIVHRLVLLTKTKMRAERVEHFNELTKDFAENCQ